MLLFPEGWIWRKQEQELGVGSWGNHNIRIQEREIRKIGGLGDGDYGPHLKFLHNLVVGPLLLLPVGWIC